MHVSDFAPFLDRWSDEEMANCAICLCHMVDKGLASYIAKRDREFVEQGGIRERMTAARQGYRTNQKEEIARLKAELEAANAEIARLKGMLSRGE